MEESVVFIFLIKQMETMLWSYQESAKSQNNGIGVSISLKL